MASLVVSALSTWSNKGLKKAEKDVSAFDKTIKNLAKTFAGVFSAQAILNFGKSAAKAFIADEKAAKSLEVQLNNLGYSFAVPGVELYIANLQKMYGVMDDQLRPAFQTLVTASGSLTKSQEALDVALNVSAATGRSVEQVSTALARGFTGQTTALSRLGAGLDKATLASGDMNKIMAALQAKFAGQATARLDTYAGKMDRLAVSAANAQEIIGKDLLDAISLLGKDQSIDNAADAMEDLATNVGNVVVGMAALIAKAKELTGLGGGKGQSNIFMAIPVLGSYLTALSNYGAAQKREQNQPTSNFTYSLGSSAAADIARVKELDLLRKRNQVQASLLTKEREKLALNELEKKFDLERIGLTTALNFATDEETKLRIKAQLALLDNNAALAKKYNAELDAARAAKELADSARDAAGSLRNVYENAPDYGAFRELPSYLSGVPLGGGVPMGTTGGTTIQNNQFDINTQGTIIGQDDFTDQVQKAMQTIVTNGYITAPAGFRGFI
jgi:hypothetical protein